MESQTINSLIDFSKNFAAAAVEAIVIRINENLGLEIDQPTYKDINNITRKIDEQIQFFYHTSFRREFGRALIFAGEEVEKNSEWTGDKIVASIDAVDGTDLVVRGFYNWCTAMFFFIPDGKVIGSVVGTPSSKIGRTSAGGMKEIPSGQIYYATEEGAYKSEPNIDGEIREINLKIPQKNKRKSLEKASLCFYGQKAGNYLSLVKKKRFIKKLESFELKAVKHPIPFRLYNFGGNPMIVKIAEGYVDAVIELEGQKAYDVIPGAFIAQRAGAFWGDLKGRSIDNKYLRENGFFSDSNKKLSYIIAASHKLYEELLEDLRA